MTRCRTIVAVALVLLGAGVSPAHAQGIQPAQVDLVNNWYVRYLGRGADPAGIQYWGRQLACGKPSVVVLSGILGSDEYFQRHGGNPIGFVVGLYADVLGRGATAQDVNYWTHQLQKGRRMSRQRLAQQFLQAAAVELASAPPQVRVLVVPQAPQTPPPPQPLVVPQGQLPPPRPLPYNAPQTQPPPPQPLPYP